MTKNFRRIKTGIVMGALLLSLFAAMMPNAYAGPVFGLNNYVDVTWENKSQEPLIPRQDQIDLNLNIRYGVTQGPLGNLVIGLHRGRQVNIKLDIIEEETTSWVSANLKSGTVVTSVPTRGEERLSTTLTLSIDEDAPAFAAGIITIKASVDKIGLIDGFSQKFALRFRPAYLPLLSYNTPEGNSRIIGPMDSVQFPIDITNKGNDKTKVQLEIENIPKDWLAVVTDEVTINKGETGTAYLTIKPPKEFNYHYDQAQFRIKMTPLFAENIQHKGDPSYVTFVVESRGFSYVGIEVAVLPIIVVIIILIVVFYLFSKRQKKK